MSLTQECVSNSKSSNCSTKPLTQPVLLTCLEHQAPSTSPAPKGPSAPYSRASTRRAASGSGARLRHQTQSSSTRRIFVFFFSCL